VGKNKWKQRISTKKCCPCTVNIVCHVRQSIIGCRSSRKGGQVSKTNIEPVGRWRSPRRKRCSASKTSSELTEFQQRGHTVTSASYCTILTKLRATIRRKRPGLLTKEVLLLHDNVRPHSANQTTVTLRSFKWEVLQHPPYSPDLAPSDFQLSGPLKHHLSGERFPDGDAVERAVRAWFRQQPKEFYAAGFQGLVKRWDKCLNLYGDYVEK